MLGLCCSAYRDSPWLCHRSLLPSSSGWNQGFNAAFQSCHQLHWHPSLPHITLIKARGILILQAAQLPHASLERLLKVTAFTVSIYSCVYRPYVPFKSLAGETCELVAPDYGIRAIGEKVCAAPFASFSMAWLVLRRMCWPLGYGLGIYQGWGTWPPPSAYHGKDLLPYLHKVL